MKKVLVFIVAAALLLTAIPAMALGTRTARTEKLDLTAVTSPTSNTAEGWSYDPTGDNGNPLLTLSNYGTEDAHSAPILVPANAKIVVNGDNYLDNACMDGYCDVLSGSVDGYLTIEGSGTLNIYALENHGRGIIAPMGGENDWAEHLTITGVTVNIYSKERTNNTASQIKEGIYAQHGLEFHNATVNIYDGVEAIHMQGGTPIGGVNEDNCDELLIEDSEINIHLFSANNLWNNAVGIRTTWGRIRMVNSNVTVNAGTNSLYSYLSCVVESGSLNVVSTPISTAQALCYVGCLKVGSGVESLYLSTTKFPASKVLQLRNAGQSELASNMQLLIGTFENGDFATAPNPDNNNLPALSIIGGEPAGDTHTVRFYGYGDELLSEQQVADGEAAVAPEAESPIETEDGPFIFCSWDTDFSAVTEDLDVHANYWLLGDTDLNGTVNVTDALLTLRHSMQAALLEGDALVVADFDMSGAVNVTDALLILRYSMHVQ
ncbi:MAG: dockerin type I repeat-containing protein [Clostridia bacterium]|nr:dockerin type I repeat-containing protein [Clostridia bacterium]